MKKMKKMLVLIGMLAIINVSSFANQSCPVRDSPNNNVAALRYSESKCSKGSVTACVELSKPSEGETVVFVEVIDPSDGRVLGNISVNIVEGRSFQCESSISIDLEDGKWYSLSIARASCTAGWNY